MDENPKSRSFPVDCAFGLLGAVAGGALGYFLFGLLIRKGLYAPMLPGALVGLGCGALSGIKSKLLGGLCLIIGLMAGIFTLSQFLTLSGQDGFAYFITHLQDLSSGAQIMLLVGTAMGCWFGLGREGGGMFRGD